MLPRLKSNVLSINDNIDYFSDLTQRTLSAFHLSGTESTLDSEIAAIKRFITNSKYKRIYSIEESEDSKYVTRFFTDGSSDVVKCTDVLTPAHYTIDALHEPIAEFLEMELTPIIDLKLSSNINTSDFKKIERYSEKIFFI